MSIFAKKSVSNCTDDNFSFVDLHKFKYKHDNDFKSEFFSLQSFQVSKSHFND